MSREEPLRKKKKGEKRVGGKSQISIQGKETGVMGNGRHNT